MSLAAGMRLGPYEILAPIGAGGMGEVYKARDTRLDRTVAIKILPPDVAADPDRRARIEREARAVAALSHPHICAIYDIGEVLLPGPESPGLSGAEGRVPSPVTVHYLVMEHVPGRTLDGLCSRKGMTLSDTLRYAIQIADALVAAHEAGVVHRDVKPGNVMVTEKGVVKVLDFGLAKRTEKSASGPDDSTRTDIAATEPGMVVGTVAYMSPEQAEGNPVDARSDIFSFGAVLYEMVMGTPAFQAGSKLSTLAAIIAQEPKPLSPDVPHDLVTIIGRCLRKDPAHRFQHMDDVKVALLELQDDSDSRKRPAVRSSRRKSRMAWMSAAVAVLVSAAAAVWWLRGESPRGELTAATLTSYAGLETQPSFSPDGRKVAFVWNGEKENNEDIYVKQIGTAGPPFRLTRGPAREQWPAWSPDDRWIAFVRQQEDERNFAILLISPLGGPERELGEVEGLTAYSWQGPAGLCWTPDGKWLLFSARAAGGSMAISAISVDTSERHPLTTFSGPAGDRADSGDTFPSVSPDGRYLAFSRGQNYVRDIYVMPLTSELRPAGEPVQVTDAHYAGLHGIAWAANGRELIYGGGGMFVERLWRTSAFRREKPRLLTYASLEAVLPAISHKTPRLAYAWRLLNVNLWRLDVRTRERLTLIRSTYDSRMPQYSPDGRRIAFQSNRSENLEIWTCDAEGSNCLQLTSFGGTQQSGTPRWSPDGRWIALDSRAEGRSEVYIIAADGGTPRRLTNGDRFGNAQPSWSADGRWIYFTSGRSGRMEVWKMAVGGGAAIQISRSGAQAALCSPDGKYVYYARQPGPQLCRVPADGGEEQQVVAGDLINYASFGVTAKGVYFVTKELSLQFLDLATGRITALAAVPNTWGLSVSPDDQYVIWGQIDRVTSDLMLVEDFR